MKASICVTTYNSAKTIRRTLNSVLSQTVDDYEVIIVDDHSDDNTVNIITDEYCAKDTRFKLFVNTTNKLWPYIDAFNKSYEYASGELLFRLDHDDILFPDYLEYIIKYMDSNPNIDACCTRLIYCLNKEDIDINNIDDSLYEHNYIENYNKWISYFNNCPPAISHLSGYCDDVYLFHNPSSCLRKSFYDKAHPRCIYFSAGDTIFWSQVMANGGNLRILDEYKIVYTGQHTSDNWNINRDVENKIYYQKNNNIQHYYISYFIYESLKYYPDSYIVKDNTTVKELKDVMLSTTLYFKDILIREKLYDEIYPEYKI
jgi:glycosyltransferase involved in cell wall biosynthesis